jgi:dTDP-glucose pyrophosphorylase
VVTRSHGDERSLRRTRTVPDDAEALAVAGLSRQGSWLRLLPDGQPKGGSPSPATPVLAHGSATLSECGGDDVVVMGGDRTARSSDHADDTLTPVTSAPQREPRGLRQAVRPALRADSPFVVRTGDAGGDGELTWALDQSARADAGVVVQSVAGETATTLGLSPPPPTACPMFPSRRPALPSPPAVFDAL